MWSDVKKVLSVFLFKALFKSYSVFNTSHVEVLLWRVLLLRWSDQFCVTWEIKLSTSQIIINVWSLKYCERWRSVRRVGWTISFKVLGSVLILLWSKCASHTKQPADIWVLFVVWMCRINISRVWTCGADLCRTSEREDFLFLLEEFEHRQSVWKWNWRLWRNDQPDVCYQLFVCICEVTADEYEA